MAKKIIHGILTSNQREILAALKKRKRSDLAPDELRTLIHLKGVALKETQEPKPADGLHVEGDETILMQAGNAVKVKKPKDDHGEEENQEDGEGEGSGSSDDDAAATDSGEGNAPPETESDHP